MSKSTLKRFHEATASCLNPQSAPPRKAQLNSESWGKVEEKIQAAKDFKEAMSKIQEKEAVDHPDHYNEGIETIDYIESWEMDFSQGNVIKYVSRYKSKGGLEDLKKAQWYLERLIQKEEENV